MSTVKLERMCRTCLSETGDMKSLNCTVDGSRKLKEILEFVLDRHVNNDDRLPKLICVDCEALLVQVEVFKKRCLDSEDTLRDCIEGFPNKVNYEEIDQNSILKSEIYDSITNVLKQDNEELLNVKQFNDITIKRCSFENSDKDDYNDADSIKEEHNYSENEVQNLKPKNIKPKPSTNKLKKVKRKKLKVIHIANQLECQKCDETFSNVTAWSVHQKTHPATKKISRKEGYKCKVCPKTFKQKKLLKTHQHKHEPAAKYICDVCKREFRYKGFLKTHLSTMHGRVQYPPEYCMQSLENGETIDEAQLTEKRHQCLVCGKNFYMASTLKDHIRVHTGERPFLCSICGKGFSQKNNLAQHVRRHQGNKPHQCENCEKSFVSKGELEAHSRKHSGAHPFICDDCGRGFTTSSSLVKHRRIHTGERPYACDLCPMRFAASGTLKNHRRRHTGERPYHCSYCEKAFVQRNDLISHIRCHTGERPYVCLQCGQSFRKPAGLRAHDKIHAHSDVSHGPAVAIDNTV